MSVVNLLTSQKNEFNLLNNDVQILIGHLVAARDKLIIASETIANNYNINGEVADKNRINENIEKINEIINSLQNSVIPAVVGEISRLNAEINNVKEESESKE